MKTDLFCILFFIAVIFSTNSIYCQENLSVENSQLKNSLHGSLGYCILGGTINAGYSRFIGESNYKFFTSYWIGIDGGAFAFWEDNWRYMNLDLTALTGSGKNHVELSAGIIRLKDMYSYEGRLPDDPVSYWISYLPCGSLGYRLQKPNRGFFFKAGIGFPEFLHVGIGTRF
jgi:hypothetical protein